MPDAGSVNNDPVLDDAAASRLKQQAENVAKAREAGWNDPVPFNYETVVGGQAEVDDTRDGAEWLSDAAIYQWDDDFGDVGDKNPELEKMLFEGPDRMRAGHQIKALSFRIDIVGPERISPVRDVCISFHVNISHVSLTIISTVQ
jgi:ATP-dependent RNA helicase DDX3X